MSPAKRRQPFVQSRPRSEVVLAISVSAGIVVGTALLVWLIRPGQPGVEGGGGLFNRQPRATILVLLAAALIAVLAVVVVRRRHPPRFGVRGSIALGSGVTVVLAVGAGIFWPGGLIHHWPAQFKLPDTPLTSVPSSTPTTKANRGTTATTATTGTTATTVTTAPTGTTTTVKSG